MCRDQNLISETNKRTNGQTDGQTSKRMKIEKPGVGRPLLGLAINIDPCSNELYVYTFKGQPEPEPE